MKCQLIFSEKKKKKKEKFKMPSAAAVTGLWGLLFTNPGIFLNFFQKIGIHYTYAGFLVKNFRGGKSRIWGGQNGYYLHNRIYHMYSDRPAWANSVDPNELPQNVASDLGLHCLPISQQFLTQWVVNCWNFRISMVRKWGVWILRVNTVQ